MVWTMEHWEARSWEAGWAQDDGHDKSNDDNSNNNSGRSKGASFETGKMREGPVGLAFIVWGCQF